MNKNDLGIIIFAKKFVWQHTSKIIDQTEISATLRTHKNMIVADIAKSFQKSIKLDDIFGFLLKYRGARDVRNFCLVDDFWGMTPKACFCKIMSLRETCCRKYGQKYDFGRKNGII